MRFRVIVLVLCAIAVVLIVAWHCRPRKVVDVSDASGAVGKVQETLLPVSEDATVQQSSIDEPAVPPVVVPPTSPTVVAPSRIEDQPIAKVREDALNVTRYCDLTMARLRLANRV